MFPEFLQGFLVHTCFTLLIEEGVQGNFSGHVNRAATSLELVQHQVVTQTGRGNRGSSVGHEFLEFFLGCVAAGIELTKTVGYFGLEEQEPGANRTVTILEAGRGETVFHHGQGRTNLSCEGVGGAGIPDRIPGTSFTFTSGTRTEDVYRTTTGYDCGFTLDVINLVFANRETGSAGNLVRLVLVEQQLNNEDTLKHIVGAKCGGCRLGNDTLVGFAVDHDLPFTGTYRGSAFTQSRCRLGTVEVFTIVALLPDRQAPLFEQLDRFVHVAATVIDQVLADNAHQVVTNHLDIVFDRIFADVGVNSRKALGNSAGTLDTGLVNQQNFHVFRGPLLDLKSGTAGGHTTADNQRVNVHFDDFRIDDGFEFTFGLIW